MNDESLQELLRRMDADTPPMELSSPLLAGAEMKLLRRRRRARAGAALAGVFLCTCGFLLSSIFTNRHASAIKTVAQAPAVIPAVLPAELDARVALATQTAQSMIDAERERIALAKLDRLSSGPGSEIWMENQREQAAGALLRSVVFASNEKESAGVYRKVAELFPDAAAATVANARLSQLR